MTPHSPVKQDASEFEPPAKLDSRVVNCGIAWMISFQLVYISSYLFCLDLHRREYLDLANRFGPMAFALVCTAIVWTRLRRHPVLLWTPITWFIAISAMAFGVGPLIYFWGQDDEIRELDKFFLMDEFNLARTNVLNGVGMLVLCSVHTLASWTSWRPAVPKAPDLGNLANARKMLFRLFLLVGPLKLLVIIPMYLGWLDFIVPGIVESLASLFGVVILLAFFLWQSGDRRYAPIALGLMVLDSAIALAVFSKLMFILPFVNAAIGIYLAKPRLRYLALGFVLVASGYMFVKPLVDSGRSRFGRHSRDVKDTVSFVSYYFSENKSRDYYETHSSEHWWARQSYASTQAYLMNSYDNAHPGNSINHVWIVFIPRLVWPDKPLVNRAGVALNIEVFGSDTSSLAATIYGEAYWNGGWPMVVVITTFISAVFYIFGMYSINFMRFPDYRWLPVGMMGILYGLSVECWFVSIFVGGIPMFFGTWYLMKFMFPIRETR